MTAFSLCELNQAPAAMETSKLRKIELEFAEARKEIMKLRQENRKLESAISLLSKPMVLSDDEDMGSAKRHKSGDACAIVIALPQGDAKDRIDDLLKENSKLAEEIVELRKVINAESHESGIASILTKNSFLQSEIKSLESRLIESNTNSMSNLKQVQAKHETQIKQFRSSISELESHVADLNAKLLITQDDSDSKQHEWKTHISKLERANSVLSQQLEDVYRKILSK